MVINEWLTTNVDSGEGNKKVTLTSTPNNTDEDRVTTLVVKGKNKSVSVNVRQLKQSGSEGFVFYVKNYTNIPVSGSNADIILSVFSCNKPCTLVRYDIFKGQDLGMDFVAEETLEMVEGINNISLNAESNIVDGVTNPVRFVSYEIVYKGMGYGYFNIFQQGSTPIFTVVPNEVEFHKEGGTKTIEITANTNWRIGGDNYRPQITFSKTFGKSGTHTISVTAQEYEGIEDLIYNLWVGVGSGLIVPLVIKQYCLVIPQDCFYIEPIDNEVNIDLARNTIIQYYGDTTTVLGDYIYYCDGKEWIKLSSMQGGVTINKKTYFKDWVHKGIDGKVNSLMGDGKYRIGGNIETLLGEMKSGYAYLAFSSPNLVDASKLILPHTTISSEAYHSAFKDCINLVTAPQLPATNIGWGAYASMFERCASLEQAPQLPATNLAKTCYESLFESCINLINAPILPSTTLVNNAYYRIYRGCSALKTATILTTESPYGWGDSVGWNGVVYKNHDLQELKDVPTTWQVADYGNNIEISTEIPNYFYIEPSIGNNDVEIRFEIMDATYNNSFLSYYDGIGKWKMLIFENGKSTIVINKKTYFTNLITDWRNNANNEHTSQIIFNNDCKIGGDFTSLKTDNISVIELNLNDKVVDMSNLINYNS